MIDPRDNPFDLSTFVDDPPKASAVLLLAHLPPRLEFPLHRHPRDLGCIILRDEPEPPLADVIDRLVGPMSNLIPGGGSNDD